MTPEDIRDIHGLIAIPNPWRFAPYALGAIVLVIVAFFVWRWLQRRRARALTPEEIALRALRAAEALAIPSLAREFSFAVSQVIRDYVELRFSLPATSQTSEEFLAGALTQPALSRWQESLAAFLTECDLAKFADAAMTHKQMQALVETAVRFVEETTPKEAPKRQIAKLTQVTS